MHTFLRAVQETKTCLGICTQIIRADLAPTAGIGVAEDRISQVKQMCRNLFQQTKKEGKWIGREWKVALTQCYILIFLGSWRSPNLLFSKLIDIIQCEIFVQLIIMGCSEMMSPHFGHFWTPIPPLPLSPRITFLWTAPTPLSRWRHLWTVL